MLLEKKKFLYLDSVKIKLELMLNNFVEKKETFFDYKEKLFQIPKNCIFPKGVNPCFWSKNAMIFIICFRSK